MKTIVKVELRDHVSAGELRGLGFDIPESIPDDWIVPRSAVLMNPDGLAVRMEGDVMHCSMEMRLNAPFRAPLEYELTDPAEPTR